MRNVFYQFCVEFIMKRGVRIAHWTSTVFVCGLMTLSAATYILDHDAVSETFLLKLGFPTWLIYPMAIAKLSAVFMLMSKFNNTLTEWAYAGLTFNLLLAIGAHVSIGEEQAISPAIALSLLAISYYTWKIKGRKIQDS